MSVFCALASPFPCSQKAGIILLLLIAVASVSSVVGAGGAGDLSVSGGSGDAPVVEVDAAKKIRTIGPNAVRENAQPALIQGIRISGEC